MSKKIQLYGTVRVSRDADGKPKTEVIRALGVEQDPDIAARMVRAVKKPFLRRPFGK